MSDSEGPGQSHPFSSSRRSFLCSWLAGAGLSAFGKAARALGPRSGTERSKEGPRNVPNFVETSQQAGIRFTLLSGTRQKHKIVESLAGGVAWIDYNNDGYLDLLLVSSNTWEDWHSGHSPTCRLYRNNKDGTFTDVTSRAGLKRTGWGFGVAVGDYDNDGYDDLYITYYGGNVLYHNNGDGTFIDVTERAGVRGGRFGTGCAFGDFDGDGRLDLFVANYVNVDIEHLPEPGSSRFCFYRGMPVYCGPRGLSGERDILYRNNGDGTFTDVTAKAGIDPQSYYGLGVLWADYDGDGKLDLYVANDSTPSSLYHNNGDGTFSDVGLAAGVALSEDGREQAGMGVDGADYDHDGRIDLIKTNFSDDATNLYHNNGDGTFTDLAFPAGLGEVSWPYLGFGVKFLDFDNDGWKDIFVANGHVNPQVDSTSTGITYAERNFLYQNLRNGRFAEIGRQAGPGLALRKVSRGAAIADYDNDGQQEILVTNLDASPDLLRNTRPTENHSVLVKTIGHESNRNGYGARLEIRAGDLVQWDEVRSCGSYLSASDARCHFGLGAATSVDKLIVRWPSGRVEGVTQLPVDHVLIVEEGKGLLEAIGFKPDSHPKKQQRPGGPPLSDRVAHQR